jgi:hypothetical protein
LENVYSSTIDTQIESINSQFNISSQEKESLIRLGFIESEKILCVESILKKGCEKTYYIICATTFRIILYELSILSNLFEDSTDFVLTQQCAVANANMPVHSIMISIRDESNMIICYNKLFAYIMNIKVIHESMKKAQFSLVLEKLPLHKEGKEEPIYGLRANEVLCRNGWTKI